MGRCVLRGSSAAGLRRPSARADADGRRDWVRSSGGRHPLRPACATEPHAASTSFRALIEGLKKYPPPVGTTKSLIVTSVAEAAPGPNIAEAAPGPNIVQLRSRRSPGTPFWPIIMSKPLGLLGRFELPAQPLQRNSNWSSIDA